MGLITWESDVFVSLCLPILICRFIGFSSYIPTLHTSINRKLELNILRSKKFRMAKTLITGDADKGIG